MATITSAPSATAEATLTLTGSWLKDVLDPDANVTCSIRADSLDVAEQDRAGVFVPYGSTTAVVVADADGPDRLTFAVTADGPLRAAIRQVWTAARTVLFQTVWGDEWTVRPSRRPDGHLIAHDSDGGTVWSLTCEGVAVDPPPVT